MSSVKHTSEVVEGLARGLGVIEVFDDAHSEMTLSEVARRAKLTPSTARRSLRTLESLGYVRYLNKRYLLTARILTLGSAYLRTAHIEDALIPELRRIVSLFGDAASVSILDHGEILYIAHVSEQRAVRPIAGVGATYPAYPTSLGRVLLSGLSAEELDNYLAAANLEKLTDVTEINPNRLRKIIQEVQKKGYATAVDQLAYGITSLAVPIFAAPGQVIAALNSSGYSGRTTPRAMVDERLAQLRLAAGRIENIFGRYPVLVHSLVRNGEPRNGKVEPEKGERRVLKEQRSASNPSKIR